MATLRLFAAARQAAGVAREELEATTVGELLELACARYGDEFASVLASSRVWLNGEPAAGSARLSPEDEVAVLPPVSGGAAELPIDPTLTPPAITVRRVRRIRRPSTAAESPHRRLGVAWVVTTAVAAVTATVALSLLFAVAAVVAALEVIRVRWSRGERPVVLVSLVGTAVLPMAAIAGPVATAAAAAGVVVVAVTVAVVSGGAEWRARARSTLAPVSVALAAASPVLARRVGLLEPLILLALAGAYDAGAYVVGSGASSRWEGPAAGVAALIPVTLLSAVVLVPKFPAVLPFVLGGAAALLAPLGPVASSRLLGDPTVRAPALRRLASLLLLGPVWAAVLTALKP